jgi:PBP1b-binding outer membrane lipoprotein LpoB
VSNFIKMKNYLSYIAVILVLLFASCKKEEADKPKVTYEDAPKLKPVTPVDTTQIEIADLPINMEGTNILIHPIGVISGNGKGIKSSSDSEQSFTVSNYGEYQITGYLKNLKFQEIGKDSIYALTDKQVLIETATYLKTFADKSKQQFLIYSLADMDTNKDGKLDSNDIKSLYVSTISGQKFTKLSPEFQELIDWKIIESKNILYFRTIEDTNKNGEFDAEDNLQYHSVNLLDKDWKVTSYKPV